jgi:hypothetical protein
MSMTLYGVPSTKTLECWMSTGSLVGASQKEALGKMDGFREGKSVRLHYMWARPMMGAFRRLGWRSDGICAGGLHGCLDRGYLESPKEEINCA